MKLEDVVTLLNSGGNIALLVSVFFIGKVADRLARIEKALQKYMDSQKDV